MLARYKIYRGKRPADDPLPDGVRQDSRKHTRHCLRPAAALVKQFLSAPSAEAWRQFERAYLAELEERYRADPAPFAALAELARRSNVFIGCNCPTKANPDPLRCHTILALRFMRRKLPSLKVAAPR